MSSAEDGHCYDQPSHKHVSRPLQRERGQLPYGPPKGCDNVATDAESARGDPPSASARTEPTGLRSIMKMPAKNGPLILAEPTDSRASLPHPPAARINR